MNCIHCKKKFTTDKAYAEHIIEKHPEDLIRVAWANEVLHPSVEPEVPGGSKETPKTGIVPQRGDFSLMGLSLSGVLTYGAIILAVIALIVGGATCTAVGTAEHDISTLEGVYGEVQANAEELDALASDVEELGEDIDDLAVPTDWADDIASLQDSFDAQEAHILSLEVLFGGFSGMIPSCYAYVTRLEGEYVDVLVSGCGNRSVVVTAIGLGLDDVQVSPDGDYSIAQSYSWNVTGSSTYMAKVVVVIPDEPWSVDDLVELKFVAGDIYCVSAVIGESVGEESGW